MSEEDFCYEGHLEDPTTSHDGDSIDANRAIHDPRAYYLRVMEMQSAKVLSEWEIIARIVERSVEHSVQYLLGS
jgi:hypothetical protein